ncbi:MAG: putative lipid II flippase FtsW [Propionibacteriaceae bacterium]|nr:putative lipid II flippase FtsW [Propionibacteriaceae bacterium]
MATTTPSRIGATEPGTSSKKTASAWIESVLDRPLTSYHLVLASAGLLLALGMLMVLSASSVKAYLNYRDSYYYIKRQIVFVAVGLVAILVIVRLSQSTLRVLAWFGTAAAMILLILTYTSLGVEFQGNRNWLDLGSSALRLQPSEFAKLALVLWGADILARKHKLLDQPKHLLFPYLPVAGLIILLIVFQGDAGTAAVVIGMVGAVLWMVGAPLRIFAALAAAGVAGLTALIVTSPTRISRFAAFLNPTADLDGVNHQATVGMYAIASGGWWGVGLGASRQKWGTLPEAHSDFIFAVIGEELGLFGSLMVLAMFLVLGYTGIRIALRSDEAFSRYAAAGVTAWFMVQALVNLGCVLRLLPIAGVPLPLVSYGGSALLANLAAVGVLLSCARNEPGARRVLARKAGERRPRMTAIIGSRTGSSERDSARGRA